jgi:hypothetical protein
MARKRTLALSPSLSARARARIAELDQEIERLQRSEEAIVVATGAARAWMPAMARVGCQGSREGRRLCCVMPGWQYAGEGRRPVCMAAIAIGSPISDF